MIWKNFVTPLAVKSRRRVVASAFVYGLSLAVRFTSAAGEEVEIPAYTMHPAQPPVSIMIRNGPGLPYQDWSRSELQPVVLGYGQPSRSVMARCIGP